MKFGTIVINDWAGSINPNKILLYVRKTKKYIFCLNLKGEEVLCYNDKKLRLREVGNIDFTEWGALASKSLLGEELKCDQ